MIDLKFKNSEIQKFTCLCCFLIISCFSYSQTNKESVPVFILQGTVKQNGRPVEGVSLELLKIDNQIIKIITRKNGLYSFQMNKSNTNIDAEYILNIKKEGVVPGILTINTYTGNEKFNYVPYIFNLEINLTLPSDGVVKQNFGKIKWNPERNIFVLEKDNNNMVERGGDSIKTDSNKSSLTVIEKTEAVKDTTAIVNSTAKANADSIASQQLADKEDIHQRLESKVSDAINNVSNSNAKKEGENNKKELAGNNIKDSKAEAKALDQKSETSDNTSDKDKQKQKINELAKQKTDEKAGKLTNSKEPVLKESARSDEKKEKTQNKKELTGSNEKPAVKNKQVGSASAKDEKTYATNKNELAEKSGKLIPNKLKVSVPLSEKTEALTNKNELTDNTGKAIAKSKQLNINTTSTNEPGSFNGVTVFATNNEKNRLLEIKEKMERKKTANLAKKYETSNILTSLLDVVEEFDEK